MRLLVAGAAANVWRVFHADAVAETGANVVAVTDPNMAGARKVAQEHGAALASDFEELLAHEADVAVILAPHVHHAKLTIAALDAGLHVLVEKPMATTAADAERMVETAHRRGRLLAVALQHRTAEHVRAAARLLDAEELGEIQRVDLLSCWPRRTSYFATAPWRGTWAGEGGGILVNQGQHALDLLWRLAGLPATVYAHTSNATHGLEVEDTATALLRWPNGATGSLRMTSAEVGPRLRLEITGTRGRLRLCPDRLHLWRSARDFRDYAAAPGDPYAPPETADQETTAGGEGTHAAIYRNLAAALEHREPLVAPGWDAVAAVELANALVMSAREHAETALPIDREEAKRVLDRLRRPEPATGPHTGGGAT